MHPNATNSAIVLCLMPDDFTCQEESAGSQWLKLSQILYLAKVLLVESVVSVTGP